MSSLILSVSPEKVERPYYFYMTKIKVYSLEELYYHCYHHWKHSIDDFIMGKLEDWITVELGLSHISGQISKIKDEYPSITEQYIRFLGLIDYFYESEMDSLKKELFKWENKSEWEKCKEKADYFMAENKPEEAIKWYKKAIVFDENAKLYNNMGVACIHLGLYEDASYFLTKAYEKEPVSSSILLNLIEVFMLKKDYEKVEEYLNEVAKIEDSNIIWFYYGELYDHQGFEEKAIESYEKSIQRGDTFDSYIRLARLYKRTKQYNKAVEYLEQIPTSHRNAVFWLEYANLYETWHKNDEALKCVKISIEQNKKSVQSWVTLARLYRKNHMLEEALKAIYEALKINDEDDGAKFELAKIQKEQGNKTDYQLSLKELIKKWIHKFRQDSV